MQSCIKDKDEVFIPTHTDYPTNSLKTLIPSKSMHLKLSNSQSHKLKTDFNSYIEIDRGAFLSETEGEIQYELNVIELKNYVDFILQNVDHESSIGITNTIYSFYIAAEQDGNQLSFQEGKTMRVRFPIENEAPGDLALGFGKTIDNSLVWDYFSSNINSRVDYIAWESIQEDGSMKTEYGYEIIINSPGWYSLVSKENNQGFTSSLCVNFEPDFNGDNTAVYLMMNDKRYITKLKMINDNSSTFCLNNLPPTDTHPYTIVSISKSENEEYYYQEKDFEMGSEALNLTFNPSQIDLYDITKELEAL